MTSLNFDLKATISNEFIKLYVEGETGSLTVHTYDSKFFSNPLSDENLKNESSRLQKSFKEITGEEKELVYFKSFLDNITEKYLLTKIEKIKIDNERLQSFLLYHIKTLRSVKRNFNIDHNNGIAYIDTELYNIGNMTVDNLFTILDTITKKRNEKK